MRRLSALFLFVTALCAADSAPAIEWVKAIGGNGASVITAASADRQGNFYFGGSTSSLDLPVVNAAQPNSGGSPLVRINTASGIPKKLYPAGFSSISTMAADPQNRDTLYAAVKNAIWKSTDAGSTWFSLGQLASDTTVIAFAVDPTDAKTLYAGAGTGLFKSTDGGMTFRTLDFDIGPVRSGSNYANGIWIDPRSPGTLFAATGNGLLRSTDGGSHWTIVIAASVFLSLAFDPFEPATIFATTGATIRKSTDGGQTFAAVSALPDGVTMNTLLADPLHPGVLYGTGYGGIAQSKDAGATWTPVNTSFALSLAADPAQPVLYASLYGVGVAESTDGFATTTLIDPVAAPVKQLVPSPAGLFAVVEPTGDAFVVKLDPDGQIVYATYFGGNSNDAATGLAVGADGSVYVTGTTTSPDFPVTAGVFQPKFPTNSGSNFLFKLSPGGSLAWSTLFADTKSISYAVALDSSGNPYISGQSGGNLPTTPGAYQTEFEQGSFCTGFIGCFPGPTSAFVTKFNADATALVYSTYVPMDASKNLVQQAVALAVDSDGNAYFGGRGNVIVLNSTGTGILAAAALPGISIASIALDPKSNVYATGTTMPPFAGSQPFPATPGAFQIQPQPAIPSLPGQLPAGGLSDAFVMKWNRDLSEIQAATLLGGELADAGESIALDGSGNVIVSGYTDSRAFPLHAPFQTSFSSRSGFVAGLDSNLSHLLFSTYVGDTRAFDAHAAVADANGNLLVAGATLNLGGPFVGGDPGQSFTSGGIAVANKISLPAPATPRLDAVKNAASQIASPIAPGEVLVATGSGFGGDAQIVLDGVPLKTLQATPNSIVAQVSLDAKISGSYEVQAASGGNLSNAVLAPAAPASPGIYSADGSGFGQGLIWNADGTINSPQNPAALGSAITIYATGAGRYTWAGPYAVTEQTPAVFVDGFYANGIAATSGAVSGIPGDAYQIQVYVPDPSQYASQNPNLLNFKMPPQVGVTLVMGTVNPSNPMNSVSTSQLGIVLNVK
ncbi:MAG TPA: hypothetical protein VF146_11515 [Bryobacteraceae bacterium]